MALESGRLPKEGLFVSCRKRLYVDDVTDLLCALEMGFFIRLSVDLG